MADDTLAAVKELAPAKRVTTYERLQRELQQRGPFAIMLQEVGSVVMRKPASGLTQGPLSDRTIYCSITES